MVAPEQALPGRDTPLVVTQPHLTFGCALTDEPAGSEVAYVGMGCFWGAASHSPSAPLSTYWSRATGIRRPKQSPPPSSVNRPTSPLPRCTGFSKSSRSTHWLSTPTLGIQRRSTTWRAVNTVTPPVSIATSPSKSPANSSIDSVATFASPLASPWIATMSRSRACAKSAQNS